MPENNEKTQETKILQENEKTTRKEDITINQQYPIRMKDEIYKIIQTFYTENQGKSIKQSQISKILLKIKNQEIDPNWEDTVEFKKNNENRGFHESVQPTVSKHLKTLCSEKKILKLNGDVYIPYNLKDARNILKEELIESLSFNRENIYILSTSRIIIKKKNEKENTDNIINDKNNENNIPNNTDSNEDIENIINTENNDVENNSEKENNDNIIINLNCTILVDVRYDYIDKAKQLFKQYIGVANCYDIMEFQGKLMILLEGISKDVIELRNDIRYIVKESYKREMKHKKR